MTNRVSGQPGPVIQLPEMHITARPPGEEQAPFPENAPSVDRSGKPPLSRQGSRTLDNLHTLRLNLVQRHALAARQGNSQEADRMARTIRLVDNAIDGFNGDGPVRAIERQGAQDLSALEGLVSITDTLERTVGTLVRGTAQPAAPSPGAGAALAPPQTSAAASVRNPAPRSALAQDFASMARMGFDVGTPQNPNPEGIRAFQEFYNDATGGNIAVDGQVGPETRRSLRALVRDLQRSLDTPGVEGLAPGPADGVWGPRTEAAFEQYKTYQRNGDGSELHRAQHEAGGQVQVHQAMQLLLIAGLSGS